MEGSMVCPVCTLYLRPGMTLKSHLESHPKQKVIEALVKIHTEPQTSAVCETPATTASQPSAREFNQQEPTGVSTATPWATTTNYTMPSPHGVQQMAPPGYTAIAPTVIHPTQAHTPATGNHSFFYQQIIGGTQPQGGYLIPVFNHQMQQMQQVQALPAQSYMYHQQQMFVSAGTSAFPHRMFPIEPCTEEMTPAIEYKGAHIVEINDNDARDNLMETVLDTQVYKAMPQLKPEVLQKVYNAKPDLGNFGSTSGNQTTVETSEILGLPHLQPELMTDEDPFKEQPALSKSGTEEEHFGLDGVNLVLVKAYHHSEVQQECEEGISIDSAHIRADENMPQESNSNASWTRVQMNEGGCSRMSTYDLLARESWEGSNASNADARDPPPYFPLYDSEPGVVEDSDVQISSTSRQGIEYKCSSCSASFICPKERRVHQAEVHDVHSKTEAPRTDGALVPSTTSSSNLIGGALYTNKKVKKLVIKPKSTKLEPKTEKVEPSFDQLFTNIMKVGTTASDPIALKLVSPTNLGIDAKAAAEASTALAPERYIICVLCCKWVRDCRTLRQHQVKMHNFPADIKYRCGVCHEDFNAEPAYSEHLAVHPLECLLCGKYFNRSQNMQMHIKRHLQIRPYRCLICEKKFLSRQKLQEHRYVHTGEAPLKCGLCNVKFRRYSNLIQHRNQHHLNIKRKQKDFTCATCGDVFHSKKKLAWHKEIHENRPKACLYCSEKFVHQASLTRHVRRAHNERFVPNKEREGENVECPLCKGVYLRGSLDMHIKSHAPDSKNYSCSVCDKTFSTKWNLKLHKWTHAGRAQKPFKCDLCKGAFVREADYTAHMNSHRAIRPYTCNYCGAQFIRKYNCQRHVKEHERLKTFSCTVCGKKFHRSYYLNDHMRIHSGVRPFSCHICGKTSTTKSNHNKHVRIHHAREPVSTEN